MKGLTFVAQAILPLLIGYLLFRGWQKKRPIYEDFLEGAQKGMCMTAEILPTLIGLMTAVGVLKAVGVFSWMSNSKGLLPLFFIKMLSSSAANAFLVELYREFGTDSGVGLAASYMMCSTETLCYTLSVYGSVTRVKHTRYLIPGACVALGAGAIASIVLGFWPK